jgi:uncharacterized protein YdiU (UPF0061 family)
MRRKLRLREASPTISVRQSLLELMAAEHADFTLTFRRERGGAQSFAHALVHQQFADGSAFDGWAAR